jgi:hypothetical protein
MAYLVNIYTNHYDGLTPYRYYTHEIVLAVELLVQSYYLLRKKATYSEYFFGFRRSVASGKTLKQLSAIHVALSLFFEVILPYLKYRLTTREDSRAKTWAERLGHICELALFGYQFRYLVDEKSRFFKPYLDWL